VQEGDDRLRFVGEGELPPDLDRVNWGAFGFGIIWSILYGPRRWLIAFVIVVAVPFVVDNIALLFFDSATVFPAVQRITATFTSILLPPLAATYALVVNRQVWQREQVRLQTGSNPPIPLWRYRKSLRFWARLFVVVFVLNVGIWAGLAAFGILPLASLLPGMGLVLAVGLFVYDRRRMREAA